jgi:hypothetical protein
MRYLILVSVAALAGCVTSGAPSYKKAEVIESMGNKDEPEWALGDKTMFEESGDAIFVSQISMSGNSRTEACLKSSELDGKSAMLQYIKSNITTSAQLNETDAASDPGYESLTAALAQGKISGVKTKERFWSKKLISDESGNRVLKLFCATKLAISKTELARQLAEATRKNGGNPEIRKALLDSQKSFIEGLSQEQIPAH